MGDWLGCVAADRGCLAMTGADAAAVLQGVVTNDVDAVAAERAVYAALLTPQGKYLFDFFLTRRADGAIRIEAAADRLDALARRLAMYCLRRDAAVAREDATGVALAWPADAPASRPGASASRPPAPAAAPGRDVAAVPDPRDPSLGVRVYAPDPAAALAAMGVAEGDRAAYDARRIALGVPETGIELVPEETFILEAGFDRLNGVDFRKGCYVGQEVTARMRHKTELRKGLVRVAVEGAAEPGTPVTDPDGKPAGTLFSQAGGAGLAHLRFDRAGGELRAGAASLRRIV